MVVVVAGDEHHALALELLAQQLEEGLGLRERSLHPAELDVEHVAEEDELVDVVEVRGQSPAGDRPREQAVGGPGAEMEIGDHEGAHPG